MNVIKQRAKVCHLFKKSPSGLLSRVEELTNGQGRIQLKWYFQFDDVIDASHGLQFGDEVSFIVDEGVPVPPGKYPTARSVEKIVATVKAEDGGRP